MTGQLRSEYLKLTTTRTLASLLGLAAALTLFGVVTEDDPRTLFTASTSGVFFATLAALIATTSEYRYGTIHPTLVFEPRRDVVLITEFILSVAIGLVFAAVSVAIAFAAGHIVLAIRGVDFTLTDTVTLVLGPLGAGALSAVAGTAVGALIRNQVPAITALVAYAFLVDAGLFAAAPSVGRFLPGKAGDALAGRTDELLLSPGAGAAVLAAWTLALAVAALVRARRTDV